MPPKPTTPKLNGTLLLNAKEMFNATACEITPAGNGQYAVTIRQAVATDHPAQLFQETYKGKISLVYSHAGLTTIRLDATFLAYGIQDENGQCILSLFFKAVQEETALVKPTPSQIALVK